MIEDRFKTRQQITTGFAEQQCALGGPCRVAQREAHEETVQLRFRQGKGAAGTDRVLCGNHEERLRQRPGGPLDGHLALLHGLQQRALALRRGTVDFVGQHQLGEDRPGVENELAAVLVEYRGAKNVAGQQVGGELDALVGQPQHPRQGLAQGGLAHAGQVLDQQVTTRQQAGQRQAHLRLLAQQHLVDLVQYRIQFRPHHSLLFQSADATGRHRPGKAP